MLEGPLGGDPLGILYFACRGFRTVGKLRNLRVTQEDLDGQKRNPEVLAAVERLLELVVELGSTASYLSQAEAARKALQEKLSQDRTAEHAA